MVTLLAVPNVSEGRDADAIAAIGAAFAASGDARLLDVHTDPDHHRSVFTLAGEAGSLAEVVVSGVGESLARIDLGAHEGIHPRVGAIDVAPIVYLEPGARGAACAEALVLADLLGERLGLPVFLYGELAGGRTRAELRRGGPRELARRLADGELRADFGPQALDSRRGAVLVGARPPLVAFNVELAPGVTLEEARGVAAAIREGGEEGLPGVRAIGLWLESANFAQVSTNIDDHTRTSPREVVAAIARHTQPVSAELVGLAPRAAFDGFPESIPVRNLRLIEDALTGTG
jgi:glutamate formiminotransferase / 5-formyltetrahydrofolate cyclo-ligase